MTLWDSQYLEWKLTWELSWAPEERFIPKVDAISAPAQVAIKLPSISTLNHMICDTFLSLCFFALGLTRFLSEAWCTTMYWWVLSVNSIISDISIETWEEKLDLANCEIKQSPDQGLRWKHQEASSSCRLHLSLMNIFWSGSLDKTDTYRVYTSRDSTSFLTFSTRWSNSTKLFLIRMNMKPT